MNPTFPATPYPVTVIATIDDPVSRQHLSYDSWLFNERTRNWAAYMSYMQQKQQELRIRVLQQQYQNNMAKFYEYQLREQQRQALEAQQEEQRQKQQDQADMESYLKEIDEQHQQQAEENYKELCEFCCEQEAEDEAKLWYQAAEDFAKSCRAEALQERRAERRERQREARRDRRAFARADKALGKLVQDHTEPVEAEVSRAENYNADKPSRTVRYVGAEKRKGQRFQARRQFGSGWAKQQLE
jgi:hypothetical protein